MTSPAGGGGSGAEMNFGCSRCSPVAARAARSTVGSKLNGKSGTSLPGTTLRMSNGCNGCSMTTWARTLVGVVMSRASSNSASGTAGGRGCPEYSLAPV